MVFGIIPECPFGFPSEQAFGFAGIPSESVDRRARLDISRDSHHLLSIEVNSYEQRRT
jgi:hypothetical protein